MSLVASRAGALEAEFSHSICPDCMKRLYPDYAKGVADRITKDPGPGA